MSEIMNYVKGNAQLKKITAIEKLTAAINQ